MLPQLQKVINATGSPLNIGTNDAFAALCAVVEALQLIASSAQLGSARPQLSSAQLSLL